MATTPDDGRRRSIRLRGDHLPPDTVDLLVDYRVSLERRAVRPGSIAAIVGKLRLLAEHAAPTPLLDVDADTIERWLDDRQLVPRSRYTYVSHVHRFFEWAIRDGRATADPTLRIVRPRLPRHLPRPITDADLADALDQADDTMRAMLLLGAYQGLRCAEIAGLQREQILDHHDPAVLIVQGKGGHERVLPLHPAVAAALRRHGLPRAGYVFCQPDSTRPVQPWSVSHRIAAHMRNLGLDATAHQLRHWFGTKTYAASRDLRVVQGLLGHASPTTTTVYVAFSTEDARDAVTSLAAVRP